MAIVAARRFGTLVTHGATDWPSAVPCVHAVLPACGNDPAAIVIALDDKPKSVPVRDLARVRNVVARGAAMLMVSDETEAWDRLAWTRVRGPARIVEPGADGHIAGVAALRDKYPQYATHDLEHAPLIRIVPNHGRSWSAAGDGRDPLAEHRPRDLDAVVRGRRSVRAFRPDPVPDDVIRRAIAAAGWAPSPHGTQPWRFVVLQSRERRAELAEAMATTWRDQLALDSADPAEIARRVGNSRDRLVTPPVLVLLCRYLGDAHAYPDPDRAAAEAAMATQSLGAAAQNFLLSIHADGLDAGWMCAPLFCPELIVETLGLEPALEPHAFFPVGYAARDPRRRPRRDPEELIAAWL